MSSTHFELCVSKQEKEKGGNEKQAWLPFLQTTSLPGDTFKDKE